MFDPREKMKIDAEGGKLLITCPFWANDLLNGLPSKRWDKKRRAWGAAIIKQNMDAARELMKLAGVEVTDRAKQAMTRYDAQIADMGKRGSGFPAWYKFKTKPRKHQAAEADKLYGLKTMGIFWDMQTGKSKQSIDWATAHRMEGHIEAILIFVKRTLRRNWVTQFDEHCPLPTSILLPSTDEPRVFERWLALRHDYKVMIVGWESLSQGKMHEMCERFVNTHKCAVIGDETTFIANYKSIRTVRSTTTAHQCDYRTALTGTPALEGPMNLFSQFQFLDPNIIGIDDFLAYRNRYAVMGGFMREVRPGKKVPTEIVGYQNLDELMKLIAPFASQILKADVYDLPPKRPETRTVELTKVQRAVYEQIKKEGVLQIPASQDPAIVIKNVLGVALRLHQVTGGYAVKAREERRVGKDGLPKVITKYDPVELVAPKDNPKMIELCEFVEEWKGKKQGLIWAVYMPEIHAIISLMKHMGLRVGELHGGVRDELRQSVTIEPFQKGDLDVIVGNASTGGMGYTLMQAEVNCFYNNTFKAVDRVQAEERNYGDGQAKSPIVCDIAAERTVDMTALAALAEKMDMSDYIKHRLGEVHKLLDGDIS